MNDHISEKIIEQYKQDEHMMILVFAQWCINQDLNPEALYQKAYPTQTEKNPVLQQVLELTVSKEEAGEIADGTILGVLSLYGNHDLAEVVTEEIEKRNNK